MKGKWVGIAVVTAILAFSFYFGWAQLQYVTVSGQVAATHYQDVMTQFAAQIDQVYVREGQNVRRGDLLVRLSFSDLGAQLRGKQNELLQFQTALTQQVTEVQQLQNDLAKAEREAARTQSDLENKTTLFQQGAISRTDLDDAKIKAVEDHHKVTNLKLDLAAQQSKNSARRSISDSIVRLNRDLSDINESLTKNGIRQNDVYCQIRRGVVENVSYTEGNLVNHDDRNILRIIDLDSLIIKTNLPEKLICYIKRGSLADMTPLSEPRRHYHGRVIKIWRMAVVKNGETVFPVEIQVDHWDRYLVPNSNVEVKIRKVKWL